MIFRSSFVLASLAIVLLTSVPASAAVIVGFDFDGLATNQTSAGPGTTDPGVSSSNFTLAAGNATAGWSDAIATIQNNATINSLATAVAADDFFSFTVTPGAGNEMSFTDLFVQFSLGANTQPAATEFSLLSDIDGFTTSIGSPLSGSATTAFATGTGTFDLTSLGAQTGPVEFRIYYHNTGANSMTRIGIGRAFSSSATPALTLNGTVTPTAVPEPSSLAVLGLVGVAVAVRRRRTKTNGNG